MALVNTWLAIKETLKEPFLDNFRFDENGARVREDFTDAEAFALRRSIANFWKTPTIAGTKYFIISLYFDDVRKASEPEKLKWLERLIAKFSAHIVIVGVWDVASGAPFGTVAVAPVYDENFNLISPATYQGAPVYPIHARIIDAMPPRIISSGDKTSITYETETEFQQVNLISNQAPRLIA